MIGRFRRADEVQRRAARVHARAHRRRDRRRVRRGARARRDRRQRRRAPAQRAARGARDVFVRQPGESWIRPRAPFRFHGVADRELAAPRRRRREPVAGAVAASQPRRRAGRRPPARRASGCSTSPRSGRVRSRPRGSSSMGADVVKVEAVQRPDGIRFSADGAPAATTRSSTRSRRCSTRAISASAASRSTSVIPTGSRSRSGSSRAATSSPRTSRRRCSSASASTGTTVHALNPTRSCCACPRSGSTVRGATGGGFAQTMEQLTGMAWVTGYEGGPPIIPGGPVDPMVGAHAALAVVAALEHRGAHRRGAARRGAARRGRDRGHGRAGDPLRDRRHAARPARRGRCVPRAPATTRGSRSTARPTRCRPTNAPRGARPRTPDDAARELRGAGRRRGRDGARLRDARRPADARPRLLRAARPSRGRRAGVPDVAGAPLGRARARTGPRPRRRSASTPTRCCATSSASTTTSSRASTPSTSSAPTPVTVG